MVYRRLPRLATGLRHATTPLAHARQLMPAPQLAHCLQVAGNAAYREDVAAARALMAGHKPSEACANAWKVAEAYALMATRDKA